MNKLGLIVVMLMVACGGSGGLETGTYTLTPTESSTTCTGDLFDFLSDNIGGVYLTGDEIVITKPNDNFEFQYGDLEVTLDPIEGEDGYNGLVFAEDSFGSCDLLISFLVGWDNGTISILTDFLVTGEGAGCTSTGECTTSQEFTTTKQ